MLFLFVCCSQRHLNEHYLSVKVFGTRLYILWFWLKADFQSEMISSAICLLWLLVELQYLVGFASNWGMEGGGRRLHTESSDDPKRMLPHKYCSLMSHFKFCLEVSRNDVNLLNFLVLS